MSPASDGGPGRRSRDTHARTAVARTALPGLVLGVLAMVAGCGGTAGDASTADAPAQASVEAAPDAGTMASKAQEPAAGSATPEPLLTAAPDSHSQVGQLVEGFPIDLLPVPADSVILVTSAVPVGNADVQEVSLNLRTSATTEAVLALYRQALGAAGFTEVPPAEPQTDLAAESTFTRSSGDELVSIGILDSQGARTVTIGGRVRSAG
ncbi:MAG TPA: hypothetical protein VGK35_14960 [Actinotalea sp.]